MTFEKKCSIETSDIISVEFECGHCHSAFIVPIEKLDADAVASMAMGACRQCQTPSGFQLGTRDMNAFISFNESLKQIAEVMAGRNLKVHLKIKCPE